MPSLEARTKRWFSEPGQHSAGNGQLSFKIVVDDNGVPIVVDGVKEDADLLDNIAFHGKRKGVG